MIKEKVLVFGHRFGPYHIARLSAASKNLEILAVESSILSKENQWVRSSSATNFDILTLFPKAHPDEEWFAAIISRLWSLINLPDVRVIVVSGWADRVSLWATALALLKRKRIIVVSVSNYHDFARRSLVEKAKKYGVRSYHAALVGGSSQSRYLKSLGMAGESIFLGNNVVDNQFFARRSLGNGTLGAPHRQAFIVVTRLLPRKNVSTVIEAYRAYRKRVSGKDIWRLIIVGEGPERARLEALCNEMDLEAFVDFLGFRANQELPLLYGKASALVHAASSEQWGLVVNEAMACGLPVLVSKQCGCAEDLVLEGENGFSFDASDVQRLEELMVLLSTNEQKLVSMGKRSIELIKNWDPQRFARGLCGAVDHALSNTQSTRIVEFVFFALAALARGLTLDFRRLVG